MATFTILVTVMIVFLYVPLAINGRWLQSKCNFSQIFQVGDSLADTGNFIRSSWGASSYFAKLPYGQNFLTGGPTGRCSNGQLIIDYLARAAGVPLLPPIKNRSADFTKGANFAVAGSTALQTTEGSLSDQLELMASHLKPICSDQSDCANKLRNALFMIGEIGGNDYNSAVFSGKTMYELRRMVPDVVNAILNAVRKAISLGASRLVVPGNLPVGCLTVYKATFDTNNQTAYDRYQCIKDLNSFAVYQNQQLQQGIQRLIEQEKPNATIVYGDYYTAYKLALRSSSKQGIDLHRACCGGGGKYNYNPWIMCGSPIASVCENPDAFLSWDGIHLTQLGYKLMAAWFIPDIFKKLGCM